MNPDFPNSLLRQLIAAGDANNFSLLAEVFTEFPPDHVGHLMRQRPEYWYAIADSLPDEQLESLIRAITVAERDYPAFGGGSVTGTVWAFRRLQERARDTLDVLADWMLAHTRNPWVPFGSNNHGARSLAELRTMRERNALVRSEKACKENERQAADARRIGAKASHDLFAAIRRKDIKAIQALLLRGARIDVTDNVGNTALEHARSLGHASVIEVLEAHSNKLPPSL